MTPAATGTDPADEADIHDGPEVPLHPSDLLLGLIVAFLAPMFLSASTGDLSFARRAAMETVVSYGARTQGELISIAQLIGFGLAALDNLWLSFGELSVSMKLKLRGTANGLNRSAQQNQRVLDQRRRDTRSGTGDLPAMPAAAPAFEPEAIADGEIEAAIEHARAMVKAAHAQMQAKAHAAPPAAPTEPPAVQAPPVLQASVQSNPVPSAQVQPLPAPVPSVATPSAPVQPTSVQPVAAQPTPVLPASPALPAPALPARPAAPIPPGSAQASPAFPPPAASPKASRQTRRQPAVTEPLSTQHPPGAEAPDALMWASAMAAVAGTLSGPGANVSPEQSSRERMWANALGSQASSLAIAATGAPQADEPVIRHRGKPTRPG